MFEKRPMLVVSCLVILLVTIPYLFAFQASNEKFDFGGFLINPTDGHSYLAKMHQGYRGDWKFVLPYTTDQGEGAYLFLFYLGLGHIARILNLPLALVYHISRLLSAIILLWSMSAFFRTVFDESRWQVLGFSIAALGSGLGWIGVLFGHFTSDFWVSEAYPFLSMYTNPHFCLGISMVILSLIPEKRRKPVYYIVLAIVLGFVMPFAVVIVILVLGVSTAVEFTNNKKEIKDHIKHSLYLQRLIVFSLSGGGVLLYQYWQIVTDPVLSIWNEQNVTPSPTVLNLLFSLSPCLIIGMVGIKQAWKNNKGRLLVLWAAISLILIFIPWNLQRRFLTGIYLPLAGLSVYGLKLIVEKLSFRIRTLSIVLFCLIVPTNVIVLISGLQASAQKDDRIFILTSVKEGLEWITSNTSTDAIVLANEENGLYIPSLTGRRVVYGHPFETVNAEKEREFVKLFFSGDLSPEIVQTKLEQKGINIIFSDDSGETGKIDWLVGMDYPLVFSNDDVHIYYIAQP